MLHIEPLAVGGTPTDEAARINRRDAARDLRVFGMLVVEPSYAA
jgi:hypothetical protein